jgi:hypothetical protein
MTVSLSESAVMLHAIGITLSLTAIPQALIGVILREAAVRFGKVAGRVRLTRRTDCGNDKRHRRVA